MDKDFVLRTGKYSGKTIGWLKDNDYRYFIWIQENRPEMLKSSNKEINNDTKPKKELKFRDHAFSSIQPNMDFWNEGPDEMCKPYLEKQKNHGDLGKS
jgi:hypothetical protein